MLSCLEDLVIEMGSNQADSKATWNVIKTITNSKKVKESAKNLLLCDNTASSLNAVNSHFVSVGKNLAARFPQPSYANLPKSHSKIPVHSNTLALLPVDESEVEGIILSLKSNCAVGWDGISSEVLKQSCDNLTPPITHICNISISNGTFPNFMKKAVVHPIYKNGDKKLVNNYRPISVLTTLSKILERILNNCLTNFLNRFNIISKNQYGFRPDVSTEDAVIELTQTVTDNLDKKLKCYGIFLDLSKAFDTVSLPILISKLEHIGVRGLPLSIFKDYLKNRTQCVKIGENCSEDESIEFGVPQGSILGPTLFLIYVNELCTMQFTNCHILAYADDTVLLASGKDWPNAKKNAEAALRRVMLWLSSNLLTLNIDKTQLIRFDLSKNQQVSDNSKSLVAHLCTPEDSNNCSCPSISAVPQTKYLGIYVDERLNWHSHIDTLCNRVRKLIHIFRTLRYSADKQTIKMVYTCLCQSILTYCIPAWGGTDKTSLLHLERAQRAVLKVMSFKPRLYPTAKLYTECDVLTVRQLYVFRSVLRKHSHLPLDPSIICRRSGFPVSPVVQCRTAFARRQYSSTSSRIYNKIHKQINIYNLNKYKLKSILTTWLKKLSYDKTEELLLNPV